MARVDIVDNIPAVIENLVCRERQDDALVVEKIDLVLLEHLVADAAALGITKRVALENTPRIVLA